MKTNRPTSLLFLAILLVAINAAITTATMTAVTPSTPANDAWTTNQTPAFTFNATSDTNTTFSCTLIINNDAYGTNATTQNNTLTTITANATLTEGTTYWNISCTDNDSTLSSATRNLTIDITAPIIAVHEPTNNTYTSNATIMFNFTVTDNLDETISYAIYFDDAANATGTASNNTPTQETITLAEGNHSWTIKATDEAGNTINKTYALIIDTTSPNVTINNPADNAATNNATITFNFTVTDSIDANINYTFYLNGTANETGSVANTTMTITRTLTDSTYNWTIEATDDVGHSVNATIRTFTIDTINPNSTANVTATTNDDGSITISWTAVTTDILGGTENNITYAIYRTTNLTGYNLSNDTAIATAQETSYTDTTIITNTTYTYIITTTDTAGNHNVTILAGNQDNVTATDCTTTYTYTDWSSCSSKERERTGNRTCYGGGTTTITETKRCSTTSSSSSSKATTTNPKSTHVYLVINPGKDQEVTITGEDIGINKLTLSVRQTVSNVRVSVERLTKMPSGITTAPGSKTYRYFEITMQNLDDDDLADAAPIEFSVTKEWLAAQGLTKDQVALKRYHDGKWEELPTLYLEVDGDAYIYRATTPGFSYFAIAEKATATQTTTTEEDTTATPTETPTTPEGTQASNDQETTQQEDAGQEKSRKSSALLWILVIVIVALAILLVLFGKRQKPIAN